MGLLDGQRVAITGGGSGIGAATGRRMAARGASVAILDLNGDAAAKVAEDTGGPSYAVDVTDYAALEQAINDAHERLGGLTGIFNNAGGSNMAQVHDYDIDEWDRIVRLNLTGVFHGMSAAVPLILGEWRRQHRQHRIDQRHAPGRR